MSDDRAPAAAALEPGRPWPTFASVARQSVALMPVLLLARVADLAKFMVIARAFGASAVMDAFFVASSIPFGLSSLVENTAEQGFVALGTGARAEKEGSDWTLQAVLLQLAVLTFCLIAALYLLCADSVVALVGRGLSPAARVAAARLTQLLAPILLLSPVFGLLTGFHYARGHYVCRTLTPAIGAVVLALCLWWLRGRMGIHGLAIAYSAAYVVQVGLLLPLFWNLRRHRTPLPHPLSYYGGTAIRFLLPMLAVSSITSLNPIVDRAVASYLPPGAISYVDYANRLGNMFCNLVVGAFVMVFYPFLARQAAVFDATVVAGGTEKALRAVSLVMVPTLAIAAWMRVPTVRLLFERGAFTHADSLATGAAFAALAPGLLFLSLNTVLIRGFYSLHDSHMPMLAATASVVPNFLLDVLLARYWSFVGIAAATSAVQALMFLMLAWLFQRQHAPLRLRPLACGGARMMLAAAVSIASVQGLLWCVRDSAAAEEAGLATVAAVLLAALIYVTASSALGVRECRRLLAWCMALATGPAMGTTRQ